MYKIAERRLRFRSRKQLRNMLRDERKQFMQLQDKIIEIQKRLEDSKK